MDERGKRGRQSLILLAAGGRWGGCGWCGVSNSGVGNSSETLLRNLLSAVVRVSVAGHYSQSSRQVREWNDLCGPEA